MRLLKDLGQLKPTKASKRTFRFGLYECPVCLKAFKVCTTTVRSGKSTKCRECADKSKVLDKRRNEDNLYSVWKNQRGRCMTVSNPAYSAYGGRGIKFSEDFNDYFCWLVYVEALPNSRKIGYSLDRIDNNGNYEKGNLRWTTYDVQAANTIKLRSNNTSGYRGVTWYKATGKWAAQLMRHGKNNHLGYFCNKVDAAYAYDKYIADNNLPHTPNF